MSTPIKPTGSPAPGAVEQAVDEHGGIDAPSGEFKKQVEGAGAAATAPVDSAAPGGVEEPSHVGVHAAMVAGELSPEAAVDQLVSRALSTAGELSEAQREALERQLRVALSEDPTLLALQKDLELGH